MLLELDDLVVKLAGRTILDGLTCRIDSRAVGLLGPNGAGKSTLVRTLLGFHAPSRGRGSVLGHELGHDGRGIRSLVGYMPESDAFIPGMSAVRFVRYMAELHGLPPADAMERAHESLFWVGLGEARYRDVATFSTGMRQRVKLAQAIVHGPRLVLLDEPTNGLDPPGRLQMLRLILELKSEPGLHVVLCSHLLTDVEAVADSVLILKGGRIAKACDLAAERASAIRLVELELSGDPGPFLEALVRDGCEHAPTARHRLRLALPASVPLMRVFQAAQAHDVVVRRLVQKRDTLEDVFLEAMGETPQTPAQRTEAARVGA